MTYIGVNVEDFVASHCPTTHESGTTVSMGRRVLDEGRPGSGSPSEFSATTETTHSREVLVLCFLIISSSSKSQTAAATQQHRISGKQLVSGRLGAGGDGSLCLNC